MLREVQILDYFVKPGWTRMLLMSYFTRLNFILLKNI